MSKAIEGAAMLGAAVGMGALAFFDPALVASPFYDKLMASLVVGGIAMEAGAVADALMQNRGMGITTRQPAAFRQIIYGEQRVGGVIVYMSTTGSHKDQYNFVIVLAGHEVDCIENLYLDGRQVFWDGSNTLGNTTRNGVNFGGHASGGTKIGPGGQHYNFDTLVYCEARFGDQSTGDVITGLTANDPNWDTGTSGSPYLGGCCYVYLKVEYDTAMFPHLPEIKFTVRGKNNIYDPRTSTSGYTTNWALIVADMLTDTVFGLGDASVNQAQLIAAANVCDEQVALADGDTESRYCAHWHYDTATSPGDALATIMPAAAGRLSRIGGEWYIWPAYWQGPSVSFDASAMTGPLKWTPYRSFRELCNRVNGTYIAANSPYNVAGNLYDANGWYDGSIANQFPFAFQPTNYPQYAQDVLHGYASDAFLADDGGIHLPKEVTQRCVLSVAQAQRVAKIYLLRNRQQGSGSFPMSLAAWQMQPLDVMQFSFPANGWSGKQLEIVSTSFHIEVEGDNTAPSVRAEFGVQETDQSVYEWSASEELSVYDVPANPTQGSPYVVTPPSDLVLLSDATTAVLGADGVNTPRILATWVAPGDVRVTQIDIQYKLDSASTWIDAGLVNADVTSCYIPGVIAGDLYDVQIASVTASGAMSVWVGGTVTAEAPNSLQPSYSNDPPIALSQPTATTVAMVAVAVTFGSRAVNYAARTVTISAPSVPTWLYFTIADATQAGESGSPTLTATCQASNALCGVEGNTYMGAILALPAGSATRILAGGWPAPQTVQVGT